MVIGAHDEGRRRAAIQPGDFTNDLLGLIFFGDLTHSNGEEGGYATNMRSMSYHRLNFTAKSAAASCRTALFKGKARREAYRPDGNKMWWEQHQQPAVHGRQIPSRRQMA
jgi:hypothetical protein